MEQSSLEKRIHRLESRFAELEKALGQKNILQPELDKQEKRESKQERSEEKNPLIQWLKEDFLMKLGAFLLILALAWFVRYAFAENWIGPIGRISLGIVVGLGILGWGYWLIPKRVVLTAKAGPSAGQVLTATGATMMLITLSAARFVYDFFTPASALAMMALVVALLAAVSIVRKSQPLAILALLGGAVAPILVNAPEPNHVGLLSYIFILDLGVFWVASMRGWRVLILLGLLMTGAYSAFSFAELSYQENGLRTVWLFMALFFTLFFAANLGSILKTKSVEDKDVVTHGLNGLFILLAISNYVPEEWRSLVLMGLTVLAVATVFMLLKSSHLLQRVMYIYSALALVSVGAVLAFELEGGALVIAYAGLSAAALFIAGYLMKNMPMFKTAAFLPIIPFALAVPEVNANISYWQTANLFNESFWVLLMVGIALAATGTMVMKKIHHYKEVEIGFNWMMVTHYVAAALGGILLVWFSAHNIFESGNTARGVALFLYVLAGVSLLFKGIAKNSETFRIAGYILVGGVIVRLLLVEVWSMTLVARVITFVAIGALLIATAFFQRKNVHKIHK